ncbi:MAG: DNA translocase FtsK [Bacteroidales bacterium]|nr:DNA translocase FtsK [Bacteroidales bacterium]
MTKQSEFDDSALIDLDENDSIKKAKTKRSSSKKDKDKSESGNESKSYWRNIIEFFVGKRFRVGMGALLLLLSLFVFLSTISFILSDGFDQNVVRGHNPQEIVSSGNVVKNWCAAVGAWISYTLVGNGIGISIFIPILWGVVISLRLFWGKTLHLFSFSSISLLATCTVFMTFGMIDTFLTSGFYNLGGNIGYENCVYLEKLVGSPGVFMLCLFLWIVWLLCCKDNIVMAYRKIVSLIPQKAEVDSGDVVAIDDEPKTEEEPTPVLAEFEDYDEDKTKDNKENTNEENLDETDATLDSIDVSTQEGDVNVDPETGEVIADIHVAPKIEMADGTIVEAYDPTKDLSRFKFPTLDLLADIPMKAVNVDIDEQEENKKRITETLQNYGIAIKKIDVCVGPTITLFEIVPADGVRITKIKGLEDDIALSLSALGIRIIAPIPGRGTVGIEVPNKDPQMVSMRSVIGSKTFQMSKCDLPMALGCTISNEVLVADLAKMPHLLVAGATGQGKSVGLNAIITSLLYKKHPAELKFVLIDPKQVEFSLYGVLENHYLAKLPDDDDDCIITKPEKVVATLNSVVTEMENRYSLLRMARVRNIKDYNKKFTNRELNPEKGHQFLSYIVVIIDEFCDLIMEAGKDVEKPIVRIAQKARAVGIHMIIATQRPSTNVITGLIKANFPGRIAFRVTQMVDSRTILDCSGAQQLVGKGDMLFSANGSMNRIQCAFIDTGEVEDICNYISDQVGYKGAYELPPYVPEESENIEGSHSVNLNDRDVYFEEAALFIISGESASTSSLQRRFGIGYNRAGRLMDQMEAAGIVGPAQGGKPRKVLMDSIQLSNLLKN